MPALRIAVVTTALLIASGCQTAYDRDSETASQPDRPSVATAPATTDPPEPAALRPSVLRDLVLAREDFPYEWVSTPADNTDTDDLIFEEAFAACLGVEDGDVGYIAELESDSFTPDGSFEVSSSVAQYRTADLARADFMSLQSTSGRECLRQVMRDAMASELPPDITVADIVVAECETFPEVPMATACVFVDMLYQGGEAGDGLSVFVEMHAFHRDAVVATVGMAWSSVNDPGDDAFIAVAGATYALVDRFAAASLD